MICLILFSKFSDVLPAFACVRAIQGKSLPYLGLKTNAQPVTQKGNFDSYARKLQKVSCKTLHRKIYFT